MIKALKCENFTAFDVLDVSFSPGVNVFIGENGTGKTHIMKAIYSACAITKSDKGFPDKLISVFYPTGKQLGRLVKRKKRSLEGWLEVIRDEIDSKNLKLKMRFSNHAMTSDQAKVTGAIKAWMENKVDVAFIPVKDMMANAPGFRSLYAQRELHFEEVYADIIDKALLPISRGPMGAERERLLKILQKEISGSVVIKNEEMFLKNKHGDLEFTLLAEGFRKLGLLSLLIRNGTLLNGSVLFWDEPETNLNPKIMNTVVSILMELQLLGVQIFIATHDYVFLKEFDLATMPNDNILFHGLYRDTKTETILHRSSRSFVGLSPNAIDDTFGSIIDRQIDKDMAGAGKRKLPLMGMNLTLPVLQKFLSLMSKTQMHRYSTARQ